MDTPTLTTDQFNTAFEQIRGQLMSFLLRITASVEDCEDIVQDTYIKAATKLDTFLGKSSLKTWLFSIASNLATDNLRAKKRWPENVTDICREKALTDPEYFDEVQQLRDTSGQAAFEIKEHITFCLTCISKSLPLEQQLCVLLKEVYDFRIAEITEIMQISEPMVKYHLHTGRSKMVTVFEGRCALINKNGTCHQCSELNGIFNPRQQFEIEKNKISFVREAANPNREHLLDLRLQIMQETDPFESPGAALQQHHLDFNRRTMENFEKKVD